MATPRTRPSTTSRPSSKAKVDFDLDALEVEVDVPMTVKIGGKVITLTPMRNLDWQVLTNLTSMLSQGGTAEVIDLLIPDEHKEHFYAQHFSLAKLEKLLEFYMDHFGMDAGESGA